MIQSGRVINTMDIQKDLDSKPKEFFFGDGRKPRKPRILQDPNKEVTLEGRIW